MNLVNAPVTIRPATLADLMIVADVLKEAAEWLHSTGQPLWKEDELSPGRLRKEVAAGLFFMAYCADESAGTFKFQLQDDAVIYLSEQGKLSYYLQNQKGEVSEGTLEPGKPMATGWGSWQIEVAQVMPQAVLSTDFKLVPKSTKMSASERASLSNGIKVQFRRGGERDEEWLASGWQMDVPAAGETLHVAFGPKIYPLPVSLTLKDFEVERNDGSDCRPGLRARWRFATTLATPLPACAR